MIRSINAEIRKILLPKNQISLVMGDQFYPLRPVMTLQMFLDFKNQFAPERQAELMALLKAEGTVIFGGVIYTRRASVNFQTQLKRIFEVYFGHLQTVLGEKQALINLYSNLTPRDIANLVDNNIIFAMVPRAHGSGKILAALKYFPEFFIHYRGQKWKFPGVALGCHIDAALTLDKVEVINQGSKYLHPFVFSDTHMLGQKICYGSFENDQERIQYKKLLFAQQLILMFKKAEQILVTGYSETEHFQPVNNLTGSMFEPFKVVD
jgi:hypothetical protein